MRKNQYINEKTRIWLSSLPREIPQRVYTFVGHLVYIIHTLCTLYTWLLPRLVFGLSTPCLCAREKRCRLNKVTDEMSLDFHHDKNENTHSFVRYKCIRRVCMRNPRARVYHCGEDGWVGDTRVCLAEEIITYNENRPSGPPKVYCQFRFHKPFAKHERVCFIIV